MRIFQWSLNMNATKQKYWTPFAKISDFTVRALVQERKGMVIKVKVMYIGYPDSVSNNYTSQNCMRLEDLCAIEILQHLDVENSVDIYERFKRIGLYNWNKRVIAFIALNWSNV